MSELSPGASALLEAARKAPRAPSKEALERMERAVVIATGISAGAAGAGAAKAGWTWALSATGKSVLGAVALTLAGSAVVTALVVAEEPARVAAPPPPSVAAPLEPSAPNAPSEPGAPLTPTLSPLTQGEGEKRVRRAAPPPPRQEVLEAPSPPPLVVGLGSEVALLQRAKSQVDAGDWSAALSLLDQHRDEFPAAALSIEADVLRVLAWCGDGHHAEAGELAARLRDRAPRAPAVARLTGSCAEP